MKLADVLWEAANENLGNSAYAGCFYSCDAVHRCFTEPRDRVTAKSHLRAMGCDTEATDLLQEFHDMDARQGVRYMWLLLAMHVAEDEGIEI